MTALLGLAREPMRTLPRRIGTVAGYREALIERNVRRPAAIKRLFTTTRASRAVHAHIAAARS